MNIYKSKKALIVFSIIMIVVIAGIFGYLLIQSNLYKLECSRINDGVTESYSFEFNLFRKVKKIEQFVSFPYNSKDSAKLEYENAKKQGYNVELDGKNVQYYFEDIKLDFEIPNEVKKVKKVFEELKYTCKMVKK